MLILDCCYSGAFPAGRTAKADEGVQTLERFQGKGRAVLTASDATQYAFEGDDLRGSGTSSVFTRYLVEAISSGAADLDEDGDIALDELYSYVYERVVAEVPQQRPKKQEDVDGRILIARNVHWTLPAHLQHAIESPIAAQRLSAVQELGYLHRAGNDVVRTAVAGCLATLAADDSRSVSSAATALQESIAAGRGPRCARAATPAATESRTPVPCHLAAPGAAGRGDIDGPSLAPAPPAGPARRGPHRRPRTVRRTARRPAADRARRAHVTGRPPVAPVLALLVVGGVLLGCPGSPSSTASTADCSGRRGHDARRGCWASGSRWSPPCCCSSRGRAPAGPGRSPSAWCSARCCARSTRCSARSAFFVSPDNTAAARAGLVAVRRRDRPVDRLPRRCSARDAPRCPPAAAARLAGGRRRRRRASPALVAWLAGLRRFLRVVRRRRVGAAAGRRCVSR